MTQITHQIQINASPTHIYTIISDFDHYQTWNPWLRKIEGSNTKGSIVKVTTTWSTGLVEDISYRILIAEKPLALGWESTGLLSSFIKKVRVWKIVPSEDPNSTTVILTETLTGLLKAPMTWAPLYEESKGSMGRELKRLKQAAEADAKVSLESSSESDSQEPIQTIDVETTLLSEDDANMII